MDRAAFLAAARAEVAKQQAHFDGKANLVWKAERGHVRTAAAVLELSRIDDERLDDAALREARDWRELSADTVSHGKCGPAYSDPKLPLELVGEAKVEQSTREKVNFYTGRGGDRKGPGTASRGGGSRGGTLGNRTGTPDDRQRFGPRGSQPIRS